MAHGHFRSDRRNLHLHRVAFDNLRRHPERKRECIELVERWLADEDHAPARQWLDGWREMLSTWPIERVEAVVLDPDAGQTLRQCSPLAPALTPQERWAALEALEQASRSRG
jgi:hypothetical protein